MKKIVGLFIFLLISLPVLAEDDKADKGDVYYGGKAGDFSIAFNVLPVVNFVGNMLNGTTNQSFVGLSGVTSTVFNGTSFSGKYFILDKLNLVLGAGFNCLSNKSFTYNEEYTEKESVTTKGTNEVMFMLGANYLLRPGKRLQPVVGANLVYAYANKNFEKQDDRTEINADYNHKVPVSTFGLIANLGVEFFLCKSISLSALLDLGLVGTYTRQKIDDWDGDYSYVTAKQTKFVTGKMGGNLVINFYF